MRSLWLAAAAPPDWMQIVPPFGLIFCASFARFDADVVVVRADIGERAAPCPRAAGRVSQVRTGMLWPPCASGKHARHGRGVRPATRRCRRRPWRSGRRRSAPARHRRRARRGRCRGTRPCRRRSPRPPSRSRAWPGRRTGCSVFFGTTRDDELVLRAALRRRRTRPPPRPATTAALSQILSSFYFLPFSEL